MSVITAEATTKTRTGRDKQSPENEDCKDIPQMLIYYPFSEHFMFKTVLSFKTEWQR